LRKFFHINTYKYDFLCDDPIPPPGAMILRHVILHHVRKISGKSDHFWPNGSWEDFYMTLPFLHSSYSLLFEENLALWTNLNSLHRRMFCTKFYWN
jgi:hypothetical protein